MTTSNGPLRPPVGAFPVASRLLRGYAPAAVLVLVVGLIALLVPSRVPKSAGAVTGGAGGAGVNGGQGPTATNGGTGPTASSPSTQGSAAGSGTSSTSGRTVTTPGKVEACSGQALQVPGDPYSPPCVTFSGSNGGATATGVSGNTITISARLTTDQSFQQTLATLAGAQLRDSNADNERTIEALAQYFNTHYQFYGRKLAVKFFTGQGSLSAELQGYGQANAEVDANSAKSLGAFADITAESEPYATALWQDGIMGFGDPYMPNYWHVQHAPYDWSLATDGTDLATDIANYAVQKLCPAGTPAAYAGGSLKNAPRKFAGIAPQNELYQTSATTFKQIMEAHGCQVTNFQYSLDLGTESQQAANLVAQLKAGGYTTIICGCDPIFPVYLSGQAAQQSYLPEFVEIGAALVDQDYVGQLYNQQFYSHAFGISPNEATVPYTQSIGYAAYKTVRSDEPSYFVNIIFLQMEMLAIGIQMAGPNLTPASFQTGMYNYPPRLGPAGLWGFSPTQHTIPNDFREVCWSPSTISPFNNKPGAYTQTSNQRWTANDVPKGPPGCPIPSS
ncbi:MAG: type 1 periplasmic-binding domain-containing protein [Acidimicrobiales bacterium]